MKKTSVTILFFLLAFCILVFPRQALAYSLNGLNLWFLKMIPTLFPFMVLTGIMIRMNLADGFAGFFRPLLGPLFHVGNNCIYVILTGFLCGFPMGAKITADMYILGRISRDEAQFLLAFCNNIGPVYFTGFVLVTLQHIPGPVICLLGMYVLPLCYGLFLRYTVYLKKIPLSCASRRAETKNPPGFLAALDASVASGIGSITKLGGYMIFFNLWNILPFLLARILPAALPKAFFVILSILLEITGGITASEGAIPFFVLTLIHFGGLSCIAQTYAMLEGTDLSLNQYVLHKILQTMLAVVFYFFAFL